MNLIIFIDFRKSFKRSPKLNKILVKKAMLFI